mmetsp:Transcript_27359/g.64568  ORF Transcript_27359/g.64568 Transcript_27359/m.64568 type:complete len:206 (-) Transcript_27359:493-1110(-)
MGPDLAIVPFVIVELFELGLRVPGSHVVPGCGVNPANGFAAAFLGLNVPQGVAGVTEPVLSGLLPVRRLVVDGALRLDVPPAQLAVVQSVQIDVIGAGADIGAGFPLAATPLRPHRLVVPRVVVRRRKAAGAPDPVLLGDAPLAVFAARQILVDKRVVERRPVGVFVALHIPPGDPRVVGEAIQIHGVRGLLADAPVVERRHSRR